MPQHRTTTCSLSHDPWNTIRAGTAVLQSGPSSEAAVHDSVAATGMQCMILLLR